MNRIVENPALATAVEQLQIRLRVPSRLEWIEPTVDFLRRQAVSCGACLEAHAGKLALALHEALNNSVVHGNLEVSSELMERSNNAFAEALAQRSADPTFSARLVNVE